MGQTNLNTSILQKTLGGKEITETIENFQYYFVNYSSVIKNNLHIWAPDISGGIIYQILALQ